MEFFYKAAIEEEAQALALELANRFFLEAANDADQDAGPDGENGPTVYCNALAVYLYAVHCRRAPGRSGAPGRAANDAAANDNDSQVLFGRRDFCPAKITTERNGNGSAWALAYAAGVLPWHTYPCAAFWPPGS